MLHSNAIRIRRGTSLLELMCVIAIIAVSAGLVLSAVQNARAVASRMQCQSRLKNLALACHSHHDLMGAFPRGHTPRLEGEALPNVSWMARILPQFGQENAWIALESTFAISRNTMSPEELHELRYTPFKEFQCSADDRVSQAWLLPDRGKKHRMAFTSYLANSGDASRSNTGIMFHDSKVKAAQITDGMSNTILIGERPPSTDLIFGWWYAAEGTDGRGALDFHLAAKETIKPRYHWYKHCDTGSFGPGRFDDQCAAMHYWSPHSGGANFAYGDGSVRFLRYTAVEILPSLATRAGGESVEVP